MVHMVHISAFCSRSYKNFKKGSIVYQIVYVGSVHTVPRFATCGKRTMRTADYMLFTRLE